MSCKKLFPTPTLAFGKLHYIYSMQKCEAQFERESSLNLCTGQSLTESDDTRCRINTIWPPEDEQDIARNMYV
jgi:hypothetical protein